jgi:UDP-N-acetylmuramoyl-L-alanyl-D-glutamate--2,6-diaminopimelate ligase
MEVSSHALDQGRTQGIDFYSAIFTNLTQDHLDYHKSLKDYFNAKAKLFKGMAADNLVFINIDDKYGRSLKKLTSAGVVTYGIDAKADVSAKDIKFNFSSTEFVACCGKIEVSLTTSLIGRHNVYNILAAFAFALKEGIDASVIKSAIEKFNLVPGRLERVNAGGRCSVFVDYAHTEDALKNVINSLRGISQDSRIIVVFGCGGDRDKAKRPKMGRVVSELADHAIITNDNPRSEDPIVIIEDIKRGIRNKNYSVIPERLEAIRKSFSMAGPKDIILVAGKGHENYQIFKDSVTQFDDRKAIKECLESMSC